MRRSISWVVAIGSMLVIAACDGSPGDPDAGGDGVDARTPAIDGGGCTTDLACDDGVFCNGVERCTPAGMCASAAERPCTAEGETCDEAADACLDECDRTGDQDGDGHASIACGGDDCDDDDSNRYPGNPEVCNATDEDCNPATLGFIDADGDGSSSIACCNPQDDETLRCGADCNDDDATVRPGVADGPTQACDTLDNDCDGVPDEGCPCVDGTSQRCGPPEALAMIGECRAGETFCIDGAFSGTCSGAVGPVEELCDSRDNDCDGMTDEDVERTYYRDADGDGYGLASETAEACSAPEGYNATPGDCDDGAAAVSPAAAELCDALDNNCASGVDEGCECSDGTTRDCGPPDETGECAFGTQRCIGGVWAECVGAVLSVPEVCNGRDDDCDATPDDAVLDTFYVDADGDGFGDGSSSVLACARPAGHSALSGDCDDAAGAVHPGVADVCDGIDNDCNGTPDPGCACTNAETRPCGPPNETGECAFGTQRCIDGGWAECVGAVVSAPEDCNGRDDDCDGDIDDGVETVFYRDADGDGFGTATTPITACAQPTGYVRSDTDCDDEAAAINPAAVDLCDGVDNDCDGMENPGCACVDGESRECGEPDGMGGFESEGICTVGRQVCVGGTFTGCLGGVFADDAETCDGQDDDCDGATDEGVTTSCYEDRDGDTWGFGPAFAICGGSGGFGGCPTGYSTRTGDCDDGRPNTSPGASEVCNGVDDDCSGDADDAPTHECVQDSGTFCQTACGTSGQRSCNSSCQWREPQCAAFVESCNYCDDDGDGTSSDDSFVAVASQRLDTDSCAADFTPYGTAVCFASDDQVTLTNNTNQVAALWARRPVHVGYDGFHVRMNATLANCISNTNAGWAFVFAEDASASLGTSGGTNSGVPTTMRGLSVEWNFNNANDRIQARTWNGSGSGSAFESVAAPNSVSCGTGDYSEQQILDVTYVAPDASSSRAARLTVAVVENPSPPLILFDSESSSLPSWPVGTLLRFGVTASTSSGAVGILPTLPLVEQVGVCDSPYDGAVRIAGGGATGRLEVYHSGQWGTICEDAFDATDATVACRQLGFASGTARTDVAAGTGPIWLDDLACTSSHLGVGTCASAGWGTHDCAHTEDVGVTCTP